MEKWKMKPFIKIMVFCSIINMLIFGFLLFGGDADINKKSSEDEFEEIVSYIEAMGAGILAVTFIPATIFIGTNILKKKHEVKFVTYTKEIDDKYTPAMASFLIDNYIESNEAILATILDLELKGFLETKRLKKTMDIKALPKETNGLYLHEKYIVNCFETNKSINPIEFEKLIIEDCEKANLVQPKRDNSDIWIKIILLSIGIFPLLGVLEYINEDLMAFAILTYIIFFIVSFCVLSQYKRHNRTGKGEKVAASFKGLQKYIKDYTLLKEKDIDYVELAERYIPYALALGEASNIEDLHIPNNKLIVKYIKQDNKQIKIYK